MTMNKVCYSPTHHSRQNLWNSS